MLAFFASVTAAVPAIGASRGISFRSGWFYCAIAAMVTATILTAVARLAGKVKLLDPNELNTDWWLRRSEWEFKNYIIQAASNAFTLNKQLVERKWWCTVAISVLFFIGALCLALWVVSGHRV
jgi:hypothetical protein